MINVGVVKMKGRILSIVVMLIVMLSSLGAAGLNSRNIDGSTYAIQDFVPGEVIIGFNGAVGCN